MKVCLISDTHNYHNLLTIEPCDVLIHAGDFTGTGMPEEIQSFFDWFLKQDSEYKVVIPGNHDLTFDHYPETVEEYIPQDPSFYFLNQSGAIVNGVRIWGEPRTPTFGHGWGFNVSRARAHEHWGQVPDDIDILVTHGPPLNCLDYVPYDDVHVGCYDLARLIKNHQKLRLVVCGHIHESRGEEHINETLVVNASSISPDYSAIRQPMYFDVSKTEDSDLIQISPL